MRKTIITLITALVMFSVSLAYADNTERIVELEAEQTNLQGQYTKYQQTIQNIEKRFLEISAIIGELQRQDFKAKEKTKETVDE